MRRAFWWFPCGMLLTLALLLTGVSPAAAAPMPVNSAVTHTLVGSTGGGIDVYSFTVPGPTAAPTVTVSFTPATPVYTRQAGFAVLLNGTPLGNGVLTGVPGMLQYTLPQNPSGIVVIQVYSYGFPVSYTISTSNVPAGAPNGPVRAMTSAATATPINGSMSGTLPLNTAGSYAYYTFPSAGANPPETVSLTYAPANAQVEQAVGFNVVDQYGNTIATSVQPQGQNYAAFTQQINLSRNAGEVLTIEVFNYAPGITITYRLSVTGIPPIFNASAAGGAASGGFQPFWVENFVPTSLWSGPDKAAVSFGVQPQFSSFLVVRSQTGPRLYVYNPRTKDYAYIDAAAVGPSGPPK